MYQWLYKETIATGIKVRLDEVQKYLEEGWLDTPDKWGKEGVVALKGWGYITPVSGEDKDASLKSMTKKAIGLYAEKQFEVELDQTKKKVDLIIEVEALEAKALEAKE